MNEIITLKNIELKLKKTCVFQNLNFSCKQGEIIGITGANGSGKSVLFKLIAGLYSPSYGEVLINGENIVPERKIPANLGALIEEPGFINYYSGFKNLQYLASIRGVVGNQEINDTLKIVGLYEQKDQKVKTYSLGMRKKLGIAQAIMENPSILLLDEPMNALDKSSVENMRTLFRKLSSEKGTTILIASHSEEDIRILCDKVYAIEDKVCTLPSLTVFRNQRAPKY
ncbi:ABC transporter ATP-binding protein [Streptococcus pneumoniae]|nr:ABC transporter ATP-binding protein [Streptococcus pneumoniae]VLI91521.1 ABC transporter ATP-binding protein [Streptococcus pneumoniae]